MKEHFYRGSDYKPQILAKNAPDFQKIAVGFWLDNEIKLTYFIQSFTIRVSCL